MTRSSCSVLSEFVGKTSRDDALVGVFNNLEFNLCIQDKLVCEVILETTTKVKTKIAVTV